MPIETLERWVDKLAELGTSVVACSGGEPLLHPELERLIRRVRSRGMMAGLITNGYLLSPKKIAALNDAGLDFLQISIDNVEPDAVSKKSLRLLDGKLEWLSRHAEFDVNINSVLGGGTRNPEDARAINRRARELGFSTSIGIIHDGSGSLKPLSPAERAVWEDVSGAGERRPTAAQEPLHRHQRLPAESRRRPAERLALPRRRALLLHLRGGPGAPLLAAAGLPGHSARALHRRADIRREFDSPKSCAPLCTIGCVHRVSTMDFWRRPQRQAEAQEDRARAAPAQSLLRHWTGVE